MRRVFEHGPEHWESRAANISEVERVALTDTQNSEYWTMPNTYSFGLEISNLLSSLSRKHSHHCWFPPTLFHLLFINLPRSIVTASVVISSAWAGDACKYLRQRYL